MTNPVFYIELVVVFVVGSGEDVEKSEKLWNDEEVSFSTGV